MIGNSANPFVGPRPFTAGEQLYGRDREKLDLLDLLIAERIVLLYSPSGAGKTSLVQAGLVPKLRSEGFRVLRVMRLNAEPPESATSNRYLFSALRSLDELLPDEELAVLDLDGYLKRLPRRPGDPDNDVLIFDQFEEILTVDPTNRVAKDRFFAEVGAALRDRSRWALFSMREDYLAGLDPYLRPVPTRLSNTFRLDLLGVDEACLAMQEPSRHAGVDFTDAAARKLVDNLRRVRVQRPDGAMEDQLGQHIEPVQLQVVCRRLWERLKGAGRVVEEDVEALGDIDRSLAEYYAEQVAATAARIGVPERAVRDWFEHQLITEQGIRSQVLKGQGLAVQAVQALEEAHLVRSESRRGAAWCELAHDRLIEPVRANNAEWFQANLSVLQRQAALWESQNRPKGLLLRGHELAEAENWVDQHRAELTPAESEFLAACIEARRAAEREHRQARRIRWLAIGASIISVVAIILLVVALIKTKEAENKTAEVQKAREGERKANDEAHQAHQREDQTKAEDLVAIRTALGTAETERGRAEDQAAMATARQMATQGGLLRDDQFDLALLLHLGALALDPGDAGSAPLVGAEPGTPDFLRAHIMHEIRAGLLQTLNTPGTPSFYLWGHSDTVNTVIFSPDGKMLASAGEDGAVCLWDVASHRIVRRLTGNISGITRLAFSPDGKTLALGASNGSVTLWSLDAKSPLGEPMKLPGKPSDAIKQIGFTADGRTVLAILGSSNSQGFLCELSTRSCSPWSPQGLARPEHNRLVKIKGYRQFDATLCDLSGKPVAASVVITNEGVPVGLSADGKILAWKSRKTVTIWQLHGASAKNAPTEIPFDFRWTGNPESLVFSADDRRVAWVGPSGPVWYDLASDKLKNTPNQLIGRAAGVSDLSFSPDGQKLAASGVDGSVAVWDLDAAPRLAHSLGNISVHYAAFSSDSTKLATIDEKKALAVWDVTVTPPARLPFDHPGPVTGVAFQPGSGLLAVGLQSGEVLLVNPKERAPGRPLLQEPAGGSALKFTRDGKLLITESWHSGPGYVVRTWRVGPNGPATNVLTLTDGELSSDGHWFVAIPKDETSRLTVIEVATGAKRILTFPADVNFPHNEFSPDGSTLAAPLIASRKNAIFSEILLPRVAVWDLAANQYRELNSGPQREVLAVRTDLVATMSEDEEVRLWRLPSMKQAGEALILGKQPRVVFSPTGSTMLSTGTDETVLWDLATLEKLIVLPPMLGPLVFSPDGSKLVSNMTPSPNGSGGSAEPVLLELDVKQWKSVACATGGRNFLPREWAHYVGSVAYQAVCAGMPTPLDVVETNRRWTSLVGQGAASWGYGSQVRNPEMINTAASTVMAAYKIKPAATISFGILDEVCVSGISLGLSGDVARTCELLVSIDPANATYHGLRALSRIVQGRGQTAMPDIQFVLDHDQELEDKDRQRYRRWLEDLRNGKDIREDVLKLFKEAQSQ